MQTFPQYSPLDRQSRGFSQVRGTFMKYKNILFDLDGTLSESLNSIASSIQYALRSMGVESPATEDLKMCVGPPLSYSFSHFFGMTDAECELAIKKYREYYAETGILKSEMYPGVANCLRKLHAAGAKLVLATSKPELYAKRITEHFGISKYFFFEAGASFDESRNQKTDVIFYALEQAGITDLSATAMVGDRYHDIEGAKAAGIFPVGVLYGYGSREELEKAGAGAIVESADDLLEFLLK